MAAKLTEICSTPILRGLRARVRPWAFVPLVCLLVVPGLHGNTNLPAQTKDDKPNPPAQGQDPSRKEQAPGTPPANSNSQASNSASAASAGNKPVQPKTTPAKEKKPAAPPQTFLPPISHDFSSLLSAPPNDATQ